MIILHTPSTGESTAAVRLIGVGATGRRFVEHFHAHVAAPMHTPLADLLQQTPVFIEAEDGKAVDAIDHLPLDATQILCLAFGVDATRTEIEAAVLLMWRIWGQDAHVIGIVIGAQNPAPAQRGETMLDILLQSLDARVDVGDPADPGELAPLQWFYVALQHSLLEGLTMLDAAWDSCDVVETLDFRQVQFELFTQPFDEAAQLDAATDEALGEMERRGGELECAHGAMAVLWVPAQYQLTIRMMRRLGRTMGAALGEGALHLTIRLRSAPAVADFTAYLTLVVSLPQLRVRH